MSAATPLTVSLEKPHVTLVLRRRSPAWELTIHNKAPTSIWLDHRTVIPEDDTLTISRHSRHPDFRLKISDHPSPHYGTTRTLQIEPAAAGRASVTVTTTYKEPVPTLPVRLEFAPLPPPVFTAPTLPLEVTVLPPHAGESGYTSTTDRLTEDGCDMPPGSSLTFIGREIPSPLLRQFHVTATDAINTLLRALATTHQAVATEILAARGLTPTQITAILGGLAGL